jgi:hypothetical protein
MAGTPASAFRIEKLHVPHAGSARLRADGAETPGEINHLGAAKPVYRGCIPRAGLVSRESDSGLFSTLIIVFEISCG